MIRLRDQRLARMGRVMAELVETRNRITSELEQVQAEAARLKQENKELTSMIDKETESGERSRTILIILLILTTVSFAAAFLWGIKRGRV
jgi:hypothetical protein